MSSNTNITGPMSVAPTYSSSPSALTSKFDNTGREFITQTIENPLPSNIIKTQANTSFKGVFNYSGQDKAIQEGQLKEIKDDITKGIPLRKTQEAGTVEKYAAKLQSDVDKSNTKSAAIQAQADNLNKQYNELNSRIEKYNSNPDELTSKQIERDIIEYKKNEANVIKEQNVFGSEFKDIENRSNKLNKYIGKINSENLNRTGFNINEAYKMNVEAIKQQDPLYALRKEYGKQAVSPTSSVAEKIGGRIAQGFFGVSGLGRDVASAYVVQPFVKARDDFKAGEKISSIIGKSYTGYYTARALYDWKNPEVVRLSEKYGAGTMRNDNVGRGLITPLLAAGGTTKIGAVLLKGTARGAAVAYGTLKAGEVTASKGEKKYISDAENFRSAIQQGYLREGQNYMSDKKGIVSWGMNTAKSIPGVQLLSGNTKASTQKSDFSRGVREYYQYKLGLQGKELDTAVNAALRQRAVGLGGEAFGVLAANTISETAGQKFLTSSLQKAGITGKGFTQLTGGQRFLQGFKAIAPAGAMEGASVELSSQIGRYEPFSASNVGKSAVIGAGTAGVLGGTIASLRGASGLKPRAIGRGLETGLNIADPFEKLGDWTSSLLNRGGSRTARGILDKRISVTTVGSTPSYVKQTETGGISVRNPSVTKNTKGYTKQWTTKVVTSSFTPTKNVIKTENYVFSNSKTPTNTNTFVKPNTKTPTNAFIKTSTNTFVKPKTKTYINPFTNTPTQTNIKTNVPVQIKTQTQVPIQTFVTTPVSVNPFVTVPRKPGIPAQSLGGMGGGSGFFGGGAGSGTKTFINTIRDITGRREKSSLKGKI
jgi:hypothetical protein